MSKKQTNKEIDRVLKDLNKADANPLWLKAVVTLMVLFLGYCLVYHCIIAWL